MTYDPEAYGRAKAAHRQAFITLAEALVAELDKLDTQAWTLDMNYDECDLTLWRAELVRADQVKVGLYWCQDNRPHVSPIVPTLNGHYQRPKVDLDASFDPKRPIEAIAKDVMRRTIKPWSAQLTAVLGELSAEVQQRDETERRAMGVARAMGVTLREDAPRQIADHNDVSVCIGGYASGLNAEAKVGGYCKRVKFEIEINDDQAFAEELGALLNQRFLERCERDGKTVCPGCSVRVADSSGLCSNCAWTKRQARYAAEPNA